MDLFEEVDYNENKKWRIDMIRKLFLLLIGLVIVLGVISNMIKDGMEMKWVVVLIITVVAIVLLWIRPLHKD